MVTLPITLAEYTERYLKPAVAQISNMLPPVSFIPRGPDADAAAEAAIMARARYYEAPGYFWLGRYAEEDERLWLFARD